MILLVFDNIAARARGTCNFLFLKYNMFYQFSL